MRKKIKKIIIALFYAAALAPFAYFWTFYVMKYFHANLPLNWFFFIFFFLPTFVGVPITYAANKIMDQKSSLIEAAQERAIRSFIYWGAIGAIGALAIGLVGLLGVALT